MHSLSQVSVSLLPGRDVCPAPRPEVAAAGPVMGLEGGFWHFGTQPSPAVSKLLKSAVWGILAPLLLMVGRVRDSFGRIVLGAPKPGVRTTDQRNYLPLNTWVENGL